MIKLENIEIKKLFNTFMISMICKYKNNEKKFANNWIFDSKENLILLLENHIKKYKFNQCEKFPKSIILSDLVDIANYCLFLYFKNLFDD